MLTHILFMLIGALAHVIYASWTREEQESLDAVMARLREVRAARLLDEEDRAWHEQFAAEGEEVTFEPEDWSDEVQKDNEVRFGSPKSVFDEAPEEFELIDIQGFKEAQEHPAFDQTYSEWKNTPRR